MRTFSAAVALCAQVAFADHYFDGMGRLHLRMNDNNRFKVMQFTDLHFGEPRQAALDEETIILIKSLITKEKPDFIAVTGDIVSGQSWDREEPRFWESNYEKLALTLTNLEVPWGMVPGYHDFEADIGAHAMQELEGKKKYAASMPNFYDYYGHKMYHQFTYEIPIENNIQKNEYDARLWFFGTGRGNCMGAGGMNCIRRDQVEWFKDKSDSIDMDDKKRGNGIAFMHHPLQEHLHLVNNFPVHGQKRDMTRC